MDPITVNQELHQASAEQLLEALSHSPALTYGEKQFHAKPVIPRFVPAYVALDKMVKQIKKSILSLARLTSTPHSLALTSPLLLLSSFLL